MAVDFELVFDKEECANKSDGRGKKRSERVLDIVEAYRVGIKQGAEAVKVPMADDKERGNWHTFRYRLNAAAETLGIEVKVSIRQDEGLALVTLPKGKEAAAKVQS